MEYQGFTLWFTGLAGAGKTTVSRVIEKDLKARGMKVQVLDGDVIREDLSKWQSHPSFRWRLFILAALTVTFVVWASYARILSFGFTGSDTLAHIVQVSKTGPEAAYRLWFGNLERGVVFYRPFSVASYALDYQLSGLDPRIFNLTDIAIHWANSLCLLLLGIMVTRQVWAGALAGILFASHPALVGVVADSTNRHDTLMTLGVCLTVLFMGHAFRTRGRTRNVSFVLAGIAFALALGAKETGMIALPLVVLFNALFGVPPLPPFGTRRARSLYVIRYVWRYSAPFAVLFIVYFMLRWNATREHPRPPDWFGAFSLEIPVQYMRALIVPNPVPAVLGTVLMFSVCVAIVVLVFIGWRKISLRPWLVFVVAWLVSPIAFYMLIGKTAILERFWYIVSAPLILLISIVLVTTIGSAVSGAARFAVIGAQAVLVVLALTWIYFGPLIHFPTQRTRDAYTARSYLEQFDHAVQGLPEGTRLGLTNVPRLMLIGKTMQRWALLRWADKNFEVDKLSGAPGASGTVVMSVDSESDPTRIILRANYIPSMEQ